MATLVYLGKWITRACNESFSLLISSESIIKLRNCIICHCAYYYTSTDVCLEKILPVSSFHKETPNLIPNDKPG